MITIRPRSSAPINPPEDRHYELYTNAAGLPCYRGDDGLEYPAILKPVAVNLTADLVLAPPSGGIVGERVKYFLTAGTFITLNFPEVAIVNDPSWDGGNTLDVNVGGSVTAFSFSQILECEGETANMVGRQWTVGGVPCTDVVVPLEGGPTDIAASFCEAFNATFDVKGVLVETGDTIIFTSEVLSVNAFNIGLMQTSVDITDRNLKFDPSILIPSDSSFNNSTGKMLTNGKTYIVQLEYVGAAWGLTTIVGGY